MSLHRITQDLHDKLKAFEWISVKDRLPEDRKNYLVLLAGYLPKICFYHPEEWNDGKGNHFWADPPRFDVNEEWKEITHWMPLPEPPK